MGWKSGLWHYLWLEWWRGRATGKTLHGKPQERDRHGEETGDREKDGHGKHRGKFLNLRHRGKTLHGNNCDKNKTERKYGNGNIQ